MEQVNYQEQFNRLISAYLKDPADLAGIDPAQVATLIEKYPFSQPLYLIKAALKVNGSSPADLAKAAVYSSNRNMLYLAIHDPGSITKRQDSGEWMTGAEDKSSGTGDFVPENIVSSDFFAFERTAADPRAVGSREPGRQPSSTPGQDSYDQNKGQGIAKYDDDKMPYTFQWWLNKTRSEHANTYRPYAPVQQVIAEPPVPVNGDNQVIQQPAAEEKKNPENKLNDQIMENIFHLKSQVDQPSFSDSQSTVPSSIKHKEDRIIDRFIKEEPVIKPLQTEKIDNENKARKSSEDPNDLVSETLARIYAEQMLYHKAAETYRKLRLKFPEKSAYFADQIRELEQKV